MVHVYMCTYIDTKGPPVLRTDFVILWNYWRKRALKRLNKISTTITSQEYKNWVINLGKNWVILLILSIKKERVGENVEREKVRVDE